MCDNELDYLESRLQDLQDLIENNTWRFAISYAKTHPHEYVVRKNCSNVNQFDRVCELISIYGETQYFFKNAGKYVDYNGYTYWLDGDVLNRRHNDIYEVNEYKVIKKKKDWHNRCKVVYSSYYK